MKICRISFLLLITHCYLLTNGNCTFEFKESGARAIGLSGAFIAQSMDATAPYWNPAGLSLIPQPELASFYTNFFFIKELAYLGAAFALPTSLGGFGLAFSQFGASDYRERELYISHGFKLADQVFTGYNLKGMFLRIGEYGSASTFGFDAAILTRITENLQVAAVARNLNRPTIGASKEFLPARFVLGASFQPTQGLQLTVDFERADPQPISLKSGVEFIIAPYFILRGGIQGHPARFSGGLGTKAGIVVIDYAYSQHNNLPGNHQISLIFRFGEPKEEIYKSKMPAEKKVKEVPEDETNFPIQFNLNTVTLEDLVKIEKVGIVTAGRIIDFRNQFGVQTIDDLLKVPGMKRNIFNSLKKHLYIQSVPPSTETQEINTQK